MLDHRCLKITTIAENTSTRPGILGEWGLCMLVEDGRHRYLLDTGSSRFVLRNADVLGVDLTTVDAIILSHGHHDHTGGLAAVLARMGRPVRVVAHPAALEPKYSGSGEDDLHASGIPNSPDVLVKLGARFELSTGPTWLTGDIASSGEEPMSTPFEHVTPRAFVHHEGRYVPDTMPDDQSLYIRTDLGLVILLGCAHRGVVNIARHARCLMATETVYLILGGTHLEPATEPQVTQTIESLRNLGVAYLGVSHCTGFKAAARLERVFGPRFFANYAGSVITLPPAL